MTRAKASPAKPWAKKRARAREIAPDQLWGLQIARRMLADCHPWQRDAVIDPSKRISLLVGRGGAKTTTKRARALIKLVLLPRQYIGYAATSADQARELNWGRLPSVCEAYGIRTTGPDPDVSFTDAKMVMTCHRTGSIYRLRGVEDRRDADKFRGFPQTEFQADECGSVDPQLLEYLLDECVAPRLGEALALPDWLLPALAEADPDDPLDGFAFEPERGGVEIVGSTPPQHLAGIFYEVTRDGSDKHRPYALRDRPEFKNWDGYSSHAWTLKDVVDLPNSKRLYPALVANWEEQLKQKARKGWGDDHPIWMRESLGKWAANNTTTVFRYQPHKDGKPWNQWPPFGDRKLEGLDMLRAALAALPKDVGSWRFVLAMDAGGTRDPFAINMFAFAPADPARRMWHVFALERMRMHGKPIAEVLVGTEAVERLLRGGRIDPYGGLFGLTGWPDAIELDADQALVDELANVYGIRCKKSDRKADYKFGAIELVNGDFGDGRIFIIAGTPLEKQLLELQWKADEYGILRENKAQANHSTDTLIYGRKAVAISFDPGGDTAAAAPAPPAWEDPRLRDAGPEKDDGDDANDDMFADAFAELEDDDDGGW
jgi:hypothetical protein